MHKRAILVLPKAKILPQIEGDYFGVDGGLDLLLKCDVVIKGAFGDFDSIKTDISQSTYPLHRLSTEKNETDTEVAINEVAKLGYQELIVYGGCQGRMDHFYANLMLLLRESPKIILQDESNRIEVLHSGCYTVEPIYQYLSIFAVEPSIISLSSVAYPLNNVELDNMEIYTVSNEVKGSYGIVDVTKGKILLMQCSDTTI